MVRGRDGNEEIEQVERGERWDWNREKTADEKARVADRYGGLSNKDEPGRGRHSGQRRGSQSGC